MTDPVFLTRDQIDGLHRRSLELYGGQDGIRDETALESALAQPLHVLHYGQGDHFDIAAAYGYHLAESQAYLDGNKRVGVAAALVFLRLNGVMVPRATEELHGMMLAISAKSAGKRELSALLRTLSDRAHAHRAFGYGPK